MTEPIKGCPQPDAPELVMRADGYHYRTEDEMKELTDKQIEDLAVTHESFGFGRADGTLDGCGYHGFDFAETFAFARAAIAADRALNAPADRVGQDEAQSYQDADGCPTEKAVLQRFWRKHQSTGTPVAWLLTDENINHIQVDSVQRLIDRARLAHFTDLIIRINGKDEHYEADWLKHLVCATPPLNAPADRDVMRGALLNARDALQMCKNWSDPEEGEEDGSPFPALAVHRAYSELDGLLSAAPTPELGDPAEPRDDSDRTYTKPIGYLPAYELLRLHSGHDAQLRSAKFGPSVLDGDVPVFIEAPTPPAEQQVPVGWKLVPIKPSAEMLDTGCAARHGLAQAIYEDMLSAAPTPPAEQPNYTHADAADRDVMRQAPNGWKLVPIEPTLDQYNSACRAYSDWQVQCQEEAREHEDERNPSWGYSQPHFTHSDVYRAMLAAVPTPPAEQSGHDPAGPRDDRFVCDLCDEDGVIVYKRSEFTKNWTTFNVRKECANLAEERLKSPSLAELRAKVEALAGTAGTDLLYRRDVLAEIDKLGGGV